jgi:hypothetical protein
MGDAPKLDAGPEAYVSAAALLDNVGQDGSPEDLRRIVSAGPWGAMAVAAVAVLGLLAVWLAFFVLVFLPRGPIG